MSRTAALGLALLAAACASGGLRSGGSREGAFVEAEGTAPLGAGAEEAALSAAKRSAVSDALDLYLSSAARAENGALLEDRILSDAPRFIKRFSLVESVSEGASRRAKIRALVLYPALSLELSRLGVASKVLGGQGPRVLLEAGGTDAYQALRRVLDDRGFSVLEASALPAPGVSGAGVPPPQTTGSGPASYDLLVRAAAAASEVPDARLSRLSPFRARVELSVSTPSAAAPLVSLVREATAVDASSQSARGRALGNAARFAGEDAADELSGRFEQRRRLSAAILGLKTFSDMRRFAQDARRLPGVTAVWLELIDPPELRLRVVAKVPAEEVASELPRMKGYALKLRAVESDYVEAEAAPD